MSGMRALGDVVIIRPDPRDQQAEQSKIIIRPRYGNYEPGERDNSECAHTSGVVVAVGPGKKLKDERGLVCGVAPITVKPGDRVLLSKWLYVESDASGERLLYTHESDILGVLVDA